MSGFVSPLRFDDKPKLALQQPSLARRIVWKLFGRCKHVLYPVDFRREVGAHLCIRKRGHGERHKSHIDGRTW